MATSFASLQAYCPLCGSPVLWAGHGGRVLLDADLHPVLVGPELGRRYTLCDDCGLLADLPSDMTLN